MVEPLSALLITRFGFWISSLNAILSFLVRLSCLFCLCYSISNISVLILCKNVSRVLFDNLSGLHVTFVFLAKGSLGSLAFGLNVVFISYTVLILCIKSWMSLCKACICRFFGLGMNVSPFLSTCFCVSVRGVFVANASSVWSDCSMSVVFCERDCKLCSTGYR